ncbi:energy transducer TonB [Hymenobacter sp. BT559]|uniref:energy transducer TonB n=1 Tax=Hymenobacter sp. BT559 TaxID=2795729 RepID=UPI0018EDD994|nr:energy transducer TonB [Hymenobacter sp. BT559]MBJ6143182.1 energy transducer TonB [Hymenobacter sp. BT559]
MSLLTSFFSPSLDTIVFEGRNQAYGAYQLRQSYNNHVRKALATVLGLSTLLLVAGTAWQQLHPTATTKVETTTTPLTPIEPPTYITEQPKPVAPPAAPSQPHMATATPHTTASFPTQVTKDELVPAKPVETELAAIPTDLASELSTTEATSVGVPGGTDLAETGPATETSSATAPAVTGPYIVVEKMPEFAGGTEALMRYLRNHLGYPSEALRAQAEGRVYVSFVVQADGTIADISVPKGLGYGLDEEAQRVVRQMPAWTPGQQSHHAVPVRFTLPITFHIQ